MDIEYFLKTKCEENEIEEVVKTEELYKNIGNPYLKQLLQSCIRVSMGYSTLCRRKRKAMDIIMLPKVGNC